MKPDVVMYVDDCNAQQFRHPRAILDALEARTVVVIERVYGHISTAYGEP